MNSKVHLKKLKNPLRTLTHAVEKFRIKHLMCSSWDLPHAFTLIFMLQVYILFDRVIVQFSHICWNLSVILFIHAVYFNYGGCLNVNRPNTLQKSEIMQDQLSVKSSKGSNYS